MGKPKGSPKTGGKKKGYKAPQTLEKAAARELVRQTVTAALLPMLQAQIAHAQGIGHVYTRDKGGKFTKVEKPAEIDALLSGGVEGEHYWIFTKDPSVQAFTDLLNRALDKPQEQAMTVEVVQKPAELSDEELRRRVTALARVFKVIDVPQS